MWERCHGCNRPTVCESNLRKLRLLFGGSIAVTTLLGVCALPLIGFGAGGVAAGSTAAAWQSSIGAVQAGSIFAILQSLGATGLGSLLFGATGTALGLIATVAVKLDWCNDRAVSVKIKDVKTIGSRTTTFKVTIIHIENLTSSAQAEKFKVGNKSCTMEVMRHESLGIVMASDEKSCIVEVTVNISSPENRIRRKTFGTGDGFHMDIMP